MAQMELSNEWVSFISSGSGSSATTDMMRRVWGFHTSVTVGHLQPTTNQGPEFIPILCPGAPGGYGAVGHLYIMKGVRPDPDTITTRSQILTDALCRWRVQSGTQNVTFYDGFLDSDTQFFPSIPTNISGTMPDNTYLLATKHVEAIGTGVATWFLMTSHVKTSPTTIGEDVLHVVTGSVGTIGSGADLEVADINITTGRLYRVDALRLKLTNLIEY